MQIYNTLSRTKEKFVPRQDKVVKMFVCGPTVYDYIHIGNARTFVVFDVVAKYLRYKGYDVEYIQNITDIDDKIIEQAKKKADPTADTADIAKIASALAKEYSAYFMLDMSALGVTAVTKYAPASQYISQIINQVKRLIDKGHAYLIENDGYYFDLSTFPEYGKLSGRTTEMADDAVSRVDENPNKRNRGDFALWKFSKPGEPSWQGVPVPDVAPAFGAKGQADCDIEISQSATSQPRNNFGTGKAKAGDEQTNLSADIARPRADIDSGLWHEGTGTMPKAESVKDTGNFGTGTPGWHIEDTAITETHFGPQYDLHGGGQDLIFPHHEAEITQQESASGLKPFVKYWMHVGFLVNKDRKMSKSLGNFATAHELLAKYRSEALRFYLLSGYWRSPLDFSESLLDAAEAATIRIGEFMQRMKNIAESKIKGPAHDDKIAALKTDFEQEMDDDFNVPRALAVIFDFIKKLNISADKGKISSEGAQKAVRTISDINRVLSIVPAKGPEVPANIMAMVHEREALRQTNNFDQADKIRQKILAAGWQVEDTIYGPLVKLK